MKLPAPTQSNSGPTRADNSPARPPGPSRPTMNDVAREAGVALKTVSRFVNGAVNIDPVLAQRIGEAITKLGYRRNLAAASIRPGQTSRTIGMIIGDLANPYYSVLARAVETFARDHGYLLILASSDEDGLRHDVIVDQLLDRRVDGLIVVPPRHAGRRWDEVPSSLPPLVFVDRPVAFSRADTVMADTVLADNEGGAYQATRALLTAGAQRVAFIGDDAAVWTMRERQRGYVRALRDSGLAVEDALVRTDAHDTDQASAAVREVLVGTDADAVFAANNRSAVGALYAFMDLGQRVALVGFDDFESASLVRPAVSVVSQPIVAMGQLAARTLINRLSGDVSDLRTEVLPTGLVLRGSEQQAGRT